MPLFKRLSVIAKYAIVLAACLCVKNGANAEGGSAVGDVIFYAQCGDVKVGFDHRKALNLNLIEYKQKVICVENRSSHYGTVFKYAFGFIGSGHTENETEEVKSFDLLVDGVKKPFSSLKNLEKIEVDKELLTTRISKVRDFTITDTTLLKDNMIKETVAIAVEEDTSISYVYNFMSPWIPQMTDYYAVGADGKVDTGEFINDKKFRVEKDVKWVAVYNRNDQRGAVMVFTDTDQKDGRKILRIWDKGNYKKVYLRCLIGSKLTKGYKATYSMTRGFFEVSPESWKEVAVKKATSILSASALGEEKADQ